MGFLDDLRPTNQRWLQAYLEAVGGHSALTLTTRCVARVARAVKRASKHAADFEPMLRHGTRTAMLAKNPTRTGVAP